jgi:Tol biopolymer transport system component
VIKKKIRNVAGCLVLLVVGTFNTSIAAEKATGFAGFEAPGNIPRIFAPGLVSTDAYEFAVTFTPDMGQMYLTRRTDPGPNQIVVASLIQDQLQAAVPASFSESGGQYEPFVAPDGQAIYFGEGTKILVCRREDEQWATPQELPEAVNSGFAMAICTDATGNLYFTGGDGLMVVRRDGDDYLDAVSLDPHFARAAGGAAHGYVAPDGSFLVFDSQGRGDSKGRADLYVSFPTEGNRWSEPKNLDVLNTEGTDMCASVSPDGRFLFFSRDGNIWWVDAAVLEQYR